MSLESGHGEPFVWCRWLTCPLIPLNWFCKWLKSVRITLSSVSPTLESIQGICKRPTYRPTIVWERWHFWWAEINIDYHLIQCIRGICSSPLPIFKRSLQVPWESIQGIRKRPTHRFEDTIVWERWYFWRSEINIDYRLIYSASEVFVDLPCPSSNLVYRSLESTLINVSRRRYQMTTSDIAPIDGHTITETHFSPTMHGHAPKLNIQPIMWY